MKKAFTFVILAMLFTSVAFANHVKDPDGMPNKNKFTYLGKIGLACGELHTYHYVDGIYSDSLGNRSGWVLYFLVDKDHPKQHPFLVVHIFG